MSAAGHTEAGSSPDFDALRAKRDASIERVALAAWVELGGDPEKAPAFHSRDHGAACYCACPDGPCEHQFSGWRDITDDRGEACGGEQYCTRCGEGAMSHSMRVGP